MPLVLKFHLDEHVSPAIDAGLRRRGIDVTTTREVGLQGAADTDHIAFALSAGRVIVTHDEDYLMLHAQGVRHAGIVYAISTRAPSGKSSRPGAPLAGAGTSGDGKPRRIPLNSPTISRP